MAVPYSDAALAAEIRTDPTLIGFAPHVASGNDGAIADLLWAEIPGQTINRPAPMLDVLQWMAARGVRNKLQVAADNAATTSAATAARDAALCILDLARHHSAPGLDVTSPDWAGKMADGSAYVPGGPAPATPGLLDALVTANVLSANQKDALIRRGDVRANRMRVLFGWDVFRPTGSDVSRVLRNQT